MLCLCLLPQDRPHCSGVGRSLGAIGLTQAWLTSSALGSSPHCQLLLWQHEAASRLHSPSFNTPWLTVSSKQVTLVLHMMQAGETPF